MTLEGSQIPNVYAHRGRSLLTEYHRLHSGFAQCKLKDLPTDPPPFMGRPICIIGAGMAGLYTAMILESLNISYQIVEANSEDRIGGRIFTYHFPKSGPYDYFDVGAMRFPKTPFMKRTFNLAQERKLGVKLIPYVRHSSNTRLFYNNRGILNKAPGDPNVDSPSLRDPFGISDYIDDERLTTPEGVTKRVNDAIEKFRKPFTTGPGRKPDIQAAMDNLFKDTNDFSMRTWMAKHRAITIPPAGKMSYRDINWCETLDKSTGWYDRALTETVIESLAFDWPTSDPGPKDPNADWFCFDGGSSTLPQAMWKSLPEEVRKRTLFNSPVTAISQDKKTNTMTISVDGVPTGVEYSDVICTVPLPRLSLMDLTGVNINDNYTQWSAIRTLQYGPSIKIGIKFSVPWWETEQKIHGGQSFTDLPIRTIVYPSYPDETKGGNQEKSHVIIASYCWTQDAERLGAFINRDGTTQKGFIEVVLRELEAVHQVPSGSIKKYYVDHFAWDWSHDQFTMGAFAFFGLGSYGKLDAYSRITQPAALGHLFFAGEATSACHAWVAGALDSAWRAVDQHLRILNKGDKPSELQQKFWNDWGKTEYWDEEGNKELIEEDRKRRDRQIVMGLWRDGARPEGWEEL